MKIGITILFVMSLLVSGRALNAENPSNFKVRSATDDSAFELSKHRGKTVVLHFLLKTECPYCLRYTHDYAALAEKNSEVVHVFLKPDSEGDIQKWAESLDRQGLMDLPKIYRDPGAKIAGQFKIPNGYKFHGQSVHYPALIVLDEEGMERFRYVGKSNADRMSVKDFEAKLVELNKERAKQR
ncbi:MAG: redoxin domain-containing protein [Planctomyces sp.]|nr:redoxin domain-containing protein [Planctomyces sp.]